MSDLRIKSFSIPTTDNVLEDFNRAAGVLIKHFAFVQATLVLGRVQISALENMNSSSYWKYGQINRQADGTEAFRGYPIRRVSDPDRFEVELHTPAPIESPGDRVVAQQACEIAELESIIAAYRKTLDE